MIDRLTTQQLCLETAARMIEGHPGAVLEIGLGKGRTYSHLRSIMSDREIFVFDRDVHAPKSAQPDPDYLILGDFLQTLPGISERIGGHAVFAHADLGSENREADAVLASKVAQCLSDCLSPGGVVACDREMAGQGWSEIPIPDGAQWPYFMYQT